MGWGGPRPKSSGHRYLGQENSRGKRLMSKIGPFMDARRLDRLLAEDTMLTEVIDGLWIGDESTCILPGQTGASLAAAAVGERWAGVIHACKYPCHAAVLGYDFRGGKVDREHPEYLVARRPVAGVGLAHLVLNLVDAPDPKFFRVEMFQEALDFLVVYSQRGPVLVHCNQGLSRAPALVLAYMGRRLKRFDEDLGRVPVGYDSAKRQFTRDFYPPFLPGPGIDDFLRANWMEIA